MPRQPQVVTAVIRSCNSPVPKQSKRQCLAQHVFKHDKSKFLEQFQKTESEHQTECQQNSSASTKGNFAKPTASTLLKSRCSSKALDDKRSKNGKAKLSGSQSKRMTNSTTASAPVTLQKPRKPQLPAAARGTKTTWPSGKTQQSRTAASSTAGSTKQHSSSGSSHSRGPRKSASLSSRAPQTSLASQKSRFSAATTQSHYPPTTSATCGSGHYRSPSPSIMSGHSHASQITSPQLLRCASQEARLNQLRDHIDHLRRTSPRIGSPEFTSTRTNLAGRGRSSPGRTADTSQWQLTGNSTALFASPLRHGSRSRSRSPDGAGSDSAGRRPGTTTWVETRNRASALGAAERAAVHASPPPTWQSKRHLPRVSYPRPSPAAASRSRSSSSQTRRVASSREERVTLRSRGGHHRSSSPKSTASPRRTTPIPPSSRRGPVRTPAGRAAAPSTIDYSPQSRYMAGLLRRGAVRRPTGKENRSSGGGGSSQSGRGESRLSARRRPSAASQRSAISEPARSPGRPARSILRTSVSSSHAACDPIPRQDGYGWVSDMLDLSAPLPRSKQDVKSAKKFRDKNWSATHGGAPGQSASTAADPPCDQHKCVHEYFINSRLFPTPLYTDGEGRSQCPVCLAVGPSPAGPARRQSRTRSRSRSPAVSRAGRPRSRSCAASRRQVSLARRRSSVSWHDQVALAPSGPERGRRGRAGGPVSPERSGRSGRSSRSPGGPVCVTCPNCHHRLSLSAAELSDSLEVSRGRRPARGPTPVPVPSPPPRLETLRCPEEEEGPPPPPPPPRGRQRPSPGPPSSRGRSPVTLRSRTPAGQQPVRAMFTIPTGLFSDTVQPSGSRPERAADLGDLAGGRPGHPLWPRQLDLSPTAVRPIARGWPRTEVTRGDLGRPTDRLQRTAIGHLQAGRDPAPRRSIQTSGGATAKNTYSLRRCIGEKV